MNIRSFVANEQRQTIYTQYTYKYIRTHTYIHITHHTHHIHMHTIQIRLHLRSKPCLINFPRLLRSFTLFVLKSWTNLKKEGLFRLSSVLNANVYTLRDRRGKFRYKQRSLTTYQFIRMSFEIDQSTCRFDSAGKYNSGIYMHVARILLFCIITVFIF